jgi:hypothetical protein
MSSNITTAFVQQYSAKRTNAISTNGIVIKRQSSC